MTGPVPVGLPDRVPAALAGPVGVSGLGPDGDVVASAAARLGLEVVDVGAASTVPPVVVAGAAVAADLRAGPETYLVVVVPVLDAIEVVRELRRGGRTMVLASPLDAERVEHLLRYLLGTAAPAAAAPAALDPTGVLRGPSGSVVLDEAEQALLRLLAAGGDGDVVRIDVVQAAVGTDHARTAAVLGRRLTATGAQAKVLKVPEIGYRLAGPVVLTEGTARPASTP